MLWDPMGGWVFFDVLRQLLLERMLGLEMLNPKFRRLRLDAPAQLFIQTVVRPELGRFSHKEV